MEGRYKKLHYYHDFKVPVESVKHVNSAVFLSGCLFKHYMLKLLSTDKCQATCISQSAVVTEARYLSSEIISIPVERTDI